MAFRQPEAAPSRAAQITAPAPLQTQPPPRQESHIEESQEWVVFSPSQDGASSSRTQTLASDRTPRTAGLSRASDFGSLRTSVRSSYLANELSPNEEDGELDSLDEGLHAFREPSVYRTSSNRTDHDQGAVLPAHDGLGSFQASSPPVQEHLWMHEQYNPKRKYEGHHRRRSSVQRRLDTVNKNENQNLDEDKRIRIEKWRLDQSKALLDEIEKETRRLDRRQTLKEVQNLPNGFGNTSTQDDIVGSSQLTEEQSNEPFWRRITRRFIRDFMGIDESLLPVLFGESLPEEALEDASESKKGSSIPEQSTRPSAVFQHDESWRDKLLHRIARELGILADQFSAHPGGFSSYLRTAATPPTDYAGMPISEPPRNSSSPVVSFEPPTSVNIDNTNQSPSNPTFEPTLRTQHQRPTTQDATSWGIDEDPLSPISKQRTSTTISAGDSERAKEYWEQELDLPKVFGYLKARFSTHNSPQHVASYTTTTTHDPARRAAIIRQHHPLISRSQHQTSSTSRRLSVSRLNSLQALHGLRRPGSSCASQSLRSSQRRGSMIRSGGASSRHYWDIGGSVGSGSGVLSAGVGGGGMGAWGEV
ncbi:MAG: hypothetical protein Q9227_002057 [Pyrenula ochraceoflavens]